MEDKGLRGTSRGMKVAEVRGSGAGGDEGLKGQRGVRDGGPGAMRE